MTYNGWKNWETWNVALWIGNDERLYRAAIDYTREFAKNRKRKKVNRHDARDIVIGLMPRGTPDFECARLYDCVHWAAIAGTLNEMAFGG